MSIPIKGSTKARKVTVTGDRKNCLIICTGDSVTDAGGSYVSYIKGYAQEAAPVNATVINKAHAGQNLAYLDNLLQTEVLDLNPDIVTVCLLLNELFNPDIQAGMIAYINRIRAHVNPNGFSPLVIGMTDNPTHSDQNSSRPLTNQDDTRTRLMNAYNSFSATGDVFTADNYSDWLTLTRDSTEFMKLIHADHIHPAAPAGHIRIIRNMNPALQAAVTKFYKR